jgi:hypothetical protein
MCAFWQQIFGIGERLRVDFWQANVRGQPLGRSAEREGQVGCTTGLGADVVKQRAVNPRHPMVLNVGVGFGLSV